MLAVGMSVDALVASIARGASITRPTLSTALKTGIVFGVIEALTPIIGWLLGIAASQYVQHIDHWIAFTLLAGVGGRMVYQAFHRDVSDAPMTSGTSWWLLVATAFGTSIDAMAVGVSLAFLEVNIIVIAVAIGLATAVMSTSGVLAARFLGARVGRYAEMLGGLALIGLGCGILFEHLTA